MIVLVEAMGMTTLEVAVTDERKLRGRQFHMVSCQNKV